ncbi:Do family serine endopeptidase [Granulicella sibirica]|uniref:HtrA protease/chaperone protein n=1 Tax=Granulicella sibirica TaxID=2479048 RepID=A0A4Q0SVV0_9BACT|nr:Do family serine endopeptidase [Granulicella sibirica]RXH55173.1 HtrA protease/chaperone protein [Granulicella sibirica]
MSASTNKLVVSTRKIVVPAALAAVVALGTAAYMNHTDVHAAGISAAALDDGSVTALTALDQAMEAVASRVTPAVVNIAVTSKSTAGDGEEGGDQSSQLQQLPPGLRQFFGGGGQMMPQQPQIEHGIGSGVIISSDGYIVTNNHVVNGATQIRVTLHDRRILTGKVIGTDKLTDLAVVKVNASDLPHISWGDSTQLQPGQTVLAFGSPFGSLQFSVTRGIVSALNRQDPDRSDPRKPGAYIQTDAAINPGNSGGPLVNAHGELIGINTSIITNSGSFAGAGFAIPSQIVHATTEQLIAHGKVDHGYLGISMNDVTPENAHFFNLQDASGAIVAQVTPDSPASRGGLRQGDVITQANGQKILNSGALQVAVSQIAPGTDLNLGVIREGKQETVHLKVGQFNAKTEVASNDGDGSAPNNGKLGLAVSNLTPDARQQLQIPEQVHGVVVQNVRPTSPAEDAGLQPGDVILEVNRAPLNSADQFATQVHGSAAGKDILLLVWSKGNASYRTLRPDQDNG